MNFETDILAGVVGLGTALMLFWQIREQSKFSQRIADLEYIKLMEPKLLGIVYDDANLRNYRGYYSIQFGSEHFQEALNSAVTADWYKFHFLGGRICIGSDSGYKLFHAYANFKMNDTNKTAYIKTFDDTIAHIGTPDLKTAFESSKWSEFYTICKQ